MASENVETVRSIVGAVYDGDFSAARAAFDPEVEYTPIREWPESTTLHGTDALFGFIQDVRDQWELWTGEIRDTRESGAKVLVETRIRSIGEASGIELKGRLFHVYTFADGKIVKLQDFLARSDAYSAAGLPT